MTKNYIINYIQLAVNKKIYTINYIQLKVLLKIIKATIKISIIKVVKISLIHNELINHPKNNHIQVGNTI